MRRMISTMAMLFQSALSKHFVVNGSLTLLLIKLQAKEALGSFLQLSHLLLVTYLSHLLEGRERFDLLILQPFVKRCFPLDLIHTYVMSYFTLYIKEK